KVQVELVAGPGEAEFKLIRKVLNHEKTSTHLLVSTDADTILMACSVGRPNIHINNLKNIISIDDLLQKHKQKNVVSNNPGKDFMLVSLLMCNDYLPKLKYVNIDRLW